MAKMLYSVVVLLLHLLISNNNVMHVEAEVCESPSQIFHGLCFSDANCGKICSQEGFISGHCKGIKLRCICFKYCGGPTKPPKVNPPQTGCPNPPAGGCPKPPVVPIPKPPVVPVPKPPVIPVPKPPTGCPNPLSGPGYHPPRGCHNPPSGCPKPSGGCLLKA